MMLAIVKVDLEIYHGVPGDKSSLHPLTDTLLNCRDIVARDGAADDVIDKFKAFTALHRGEVNPDIAELPSTPRLPFMSAVDAPDAAAHCLAIRHFRGRELGLHTELIRHPATIDGNVQFSESRDTELFRLFVAFESENRVFLRHPRERADHLFIFAFARRPDSIRDDRWREFNARQLNRRVSIAKRIAGLGNSEFRQRADIACLHLRRADCVLPVHKRRFAEAFYLSARRIADLRIALQCARIDAEETQLPCKRVRDGFEYHGGHRCVSGRFTRFGCINAFNRADIHGRWKAVHQRIHHLLHADILQGCPAQHRDKLVLENPCLQAFLNFFVGEFAFFKKLFNQRIIAFCDGFNECFACFFRRCCEFVGNVRFRCAFVSIRFQKRAHLHEVNDTGKLCLFPNRQLDRHGACLQSLLNAGECILKTGVLFIHLTDKEHPWQFILIGYFPDLFSSTFHAGSCIDDNDDGINDAEDAVQVPVKILCAGGINQIEFLSLPFGDTHGAVESGFAFDFVGGIVRNGISVINSTHAFDGSPVEEHRFNEGCLARAGVRDDANVSDLVRPILFHAG